MFDTWFEKHSPEISCWLGDLHARPELGFEEYGTASYVAERLDAAGVEVFSNIGGTGVVGVLHGRHARSGGRTIGLRAELDALPMRPAGAAPDSGDCFHGCGHDGHIVTLLTTATYLAQHNDFPGTAVFIFQPAEELLCGARAMLEDGLFERFPCHEIYALHNLPGLPYGHIGISSGAALASSDDIDVTIHANGTHGSAPHTGSDAVLAAATFLTTLQQSVTRVVDTRESGVISFGQINGGRAGNVLPDTVNIVGTLRSHSTQVRDTLVHQIHKVARAVELSHGVTIEACVNSRTRVTQNHPTAVEAVIASATRIIGSDRVIENARPVMAAEDFSQMLDKVPGAYFFIGQDGAYCHHPAYVFDQAVIPIGASIFADLVVTRCAAS